MNDTILLMKNNLDALVHSEAKIEGVDLSFEETKHIMHNSNKTQSVINHNEAVIIGLVHAWELLLRSYETRPSYDLFAQYNYKIRELIDQDTAGKIRTQPLSISGCDYIAPVPREGLFDDIFTTSQNTYCDQQSQALMMLFLLCKKQLFDDGNKRASQIIVNHWLTNIDAGFAICVPAEETDYFHELLCKFYDAKTTIEDLTWDAESFIMTCS